MRVRLTCAIYDPGAVLEAIEAFAPHLEARIVGREGESILVDLDTVRGSHGAAPTLAREFLNYALARSIPTRLKDCSQVS